MTPIQAAFTDLRLTGRKALLPYLTAGYPDYETSIAILEHLDPRRCACVELGIPFSDPIADGPVIQTSFARALENGFRVEPFFSALRQAQARIRVPLAAMVSYSIVYRRGPERFMADAGAAGIHTLIIPDLPIEEAGPLVELGRSMDCTLVLIVAPTTMAERRNRIAALSEPFIYYQSVAGVTGERRGLPADLAEAVGGLRSASGKPVCVGFGISTAEQVRSVCEIADGAIVGSAIVRRVNAALERGAASREIVGETVQFISELASGIS